jgi:hypothetical protein
VRGGAVKFDHVVVEFANDQRETLPIRYTVRSGGQTRAIDLPGQRRDIKYVELWYEKAHWNTKPEVQLFGMP